VRLAHQGGPKKQQALHPQERPHANRYRSPRCERQGSKDHWLASPKREEVFGPLGVTNIRTFVDPQNPTQVAVLMDVADLDAVMGAMQTKEMADAMEYDGVLPETLVILVES
jgi:hypothetical protein